MKARILAVLLIAGAASAPMQSAEAGPLLDALRSKVGTAVFLGKIAKANFVNSVRGGLRRVLCNGQLC